jgi:hypothetical protein
MEGIDFAITEPFSSPYDKVYYPKDVIKLDLMNSYCTNLKVDIAEVFYHNTFTKRHHIITLINTYLSKTPITKGTTISICLSKWDNKTYFGIVNVEPDRIHRLHSLNMNILKLAEMLYIKHSHFTPTYVNVVMSHIVSTHFNGLSYKEYPRTIMFR